MRLCQGLVSCSTVHVIDLLRRQDELRKLEEQRSLEMQRRMDMR